MSTTAAAVHSTEARSRIRALAPAASLVGLAGAAVARFALAWQHATPVYFPDEYRYAALGRSLAHLQGATIRGHSAHFPALLQPLLTAPAWRSSSLETGYRIVQGIESVAFTLAAIPVFLLARRLGLSKRAALAVAALTLLVPDAVFAGFVLSEPIAYPLVLGAVAAGIAAIARPGRRTQAAFLVLAALATAARVQFVVLPVAYLLAALAVALRERRVRAAAREQRLVPAVLLLALLAALVRGPSTALGYYSGVLHVGVHPIAALSPLGRNLFVLGYAGGWILLPGALLGLALALARPRTRTELAFGALVATTGIGLVLEATFLGEPEFAQERYFFYVFPLLALSFCLYASRGWPLRRAHAGLAAAALLVAAVVPLSALAQSRTAGHSPFLIGVEWLELKLGNGNASLALALLAGALALVAVVCSLRPRTGTVVALATAVAFSAACSTASWAFDRANTRAALARYLPADRSWVDAERLGHVTLLSTFGGSIPAQETQLFWNSSIQSAAVLPAAPRPDDRAVDEVGVAADGTLHEQGTPLAAPLLVDGHGATTVLRDAAPVVSARDFTLWRPAGAAQLALYAPGRSAAGAMAPRGAIVLWPRSADEGIHGWLELTVRTRTASRFTIGSTLPGVSRTWITSPGRAVHVRVAACSDRGPWAISFESPLSGAYDLHAVAGTASMPRLVADRSACSR